MATISKTHNPRVNVGATPWGNAHVLHYTLATASNGGLLNASSAAPIASGDKVILGLIPGGSVLADCTVLTSEPIAGLEGKLGFEYVDGQDDARVPQDAEYFAAAAALTDKGRKRTESDKAPVTLPKDAYLVLTATAGATGAGRADVLLTVASEGVA